MIEQGFWPWGTMSGSQKHTQASASSIQSGLLSLKLPWGQSAAREYKSPQAHAPITSAANTLDMVNVPGTQKDSLQFMDFYQATEICNSQIVRSIAITHICTYEELDHCALQIVGVFKEREKRKGKGLKGNEGKRRKRAKRQEKWGEGQSNKRKRQGDGFRGLEERGYWGGKDLILITLDQNACF